MGFDICPTFVVPGNSFSISAARPFGETNLPLPNGTRPPSAAP